jgi:hypothetical protein
LSVRGGIFRLIEEKEKPPASFDQTGGNDPPAETGSFWQTH